MFFIVDEKEKDGSDRFCLQSAESFSTSRLIPGVLNKSRQDLKTN